MLLQRLRNKRLMFVGDSLNRNQWESMVCLVQSVVPRGQKTLQKFVNNGSLNVFTAHVCCFVGLSFLLLVLSSSVGERFA